MFRSSTNSLHASLGPARDANSLITIPVSSCRDVPTNVSVDWSFWGATGSLSHAPHVIATTSPRHARAVMAALLQNTTTRSVVSGFSRTLWRRSRAAMCRYRRAERHGRPRTSVECMRTYPVLDRKRRFLPAEHDAAGVPPVIEVTDVDTEDVLGIRIRQRLVVADVSADADVAPVPHHAAAEIEGELGVALVEQQFVALDVRVDPAEAARKVRPPAVTALGAEWRADDPVEHVARTPVTDEVQVGFPAQIPDLVVED